MQFKFKYAAYSYIAYILLTIPLTIINILRGMKKISSDFDTAVTVFGIITAFLFVYSLYGLIRLARKNKVMILEIASWISIVCLILVMIFSWVFEKWISEHVIYAGIGVLIMMGVTSILFGIGLIKLKKELGGIANTAGILNIIAGIGMITIILAVVSFLIYIPLTIFEILIFFKASRKYDK